MDKNIALLPNKLIVGREPPSLEEIRKMQSIVASVPQVHCKVEHHFSPGLYVREIFMPKGVIAVGKMHRHEHMFLLTKGKITIMTEQDVQIISGPHMSKSFPGIKRVVYSHEDSIILNFHPTTTTDLEALEKELIMEEP